MVRVFERSAGHFKIRRPNGYVALDTSRPMPAAVATLTKTAQVIAFPRTPGEKLVFDSGNDYYTDTPAYTAIVANLDLGAYPVSVPPKMYWGKIRIRQTLRGGTAEEYLDAPFATDEWIAWPGGSLLFETGANKNGIYFWRWLDIEIVNGRWVLVLRQSNSRRKTASRSAPLLYSTSTASTFSVDLALTAGVWK